MSEHQAVECGMFQKVNSRLEVLTARVNDAGSAPEKLRLAGECRQEADVLLNCPNLQAGRPECRACRLIAHLRGKATEFISRAARVSELMGSRKPAPVRQGANRAAGMRSGVGSLRSGRLPQ